MISSKSWRAPKKKNDTAGWTPEARKAQSIRMASKWTQEMKDRMSAKLIAGWTKERAEGHSERMTMVWSDPARRKAQSKRKTGIKLTRIKHQ